MCAVMEDYPAEIAEHRRRLFPVLNAAYKYRDPVNQDFRYRGQEKLILNGSTYTADTRATLPVHRRPENVATPSNDTTIVFFSKDSPLSNHYPCQFTVANSMLNYAEQNIMKCKSLHFDDTDIGMKVMKATNPAEQKHYQKLVAGFNLNDWRREVPNMLKKGLKTKFTSRKFLKATGSLTIVEAKPNDGYYGIAMSLSDKDIWNTSK